VELDMTTETTATGPPGPAAGPAGPAAGPGGRDDAAELAEARSFVRMHARHMGLGDEAVAATLSRIARLSGDGPDGWCAVWRAEADRRAAAGEHRAAADLYNLARFPVADSPARTRAAQASADSLARWLAATGRGQRRSAPAAGTSVPFVFRPGRRPSSPLVIVMGGIVSMKEQWASFLGPAGRLGVAIALVDFPGVGENALRYDRDAAGVFAAVMAAVDGDCDSGRTLLFASSFGGHLALLAAGRDERVRGIVTVGAPLSVFFTDPSARAAMPAITRAALGHTTGRSGDGLDGALAALALRPAELSAVTAPVTYVASLRDEIIPAADWREAGAALPDLAVYAFDDVHASPHHLRHTRLLTTIALLEHAGRSRLARLARAVGRRRLGLEPLAREPLPGKES